MRSTYKRVIEATRFTKESELACVCNELERILRTACGPLGLVGQKRIGSSITGTMRERSRDVDYFVEFCNEPDVALFESAINNSGLQLHRVTHESAYGYSKFSGSLRGFDFVFVPMKAFSGVVTNYTEDAYCHPEFIKGHQRPGHVEQVLLTKEFFRQTGLYTKMKGIGSELMMLWCASFDTLLKYFCLHTSLRVNFSGDPSVYSDSKIVVDYPFLGGRSLTDRVSREEYFLIQSHAWKVLADPDELERGLG